MKIYYIKQDQQRTVKYERTQLTIELTKLFHIIMEKEVLLKVGKWAQRFLYGKKLEMKTQETIEG